MPGASSIRIWQSALPDPVELIRARDVTASFPWHMHETYVFCVIEQGAEALRLRTHGEPVAVGQIIALNPGQIHSNSAATEAGYGYRGFYPSPERVSELGFKNAPCFSKAVIDDDELAGRLTSLLTGMEQESEGMRTEENLAIWLVDALTRHAAPDKPVPAQTRADRAVSRVCDYIQANFAQNITLKEIAGVAGLSSYHLARTFTQTLGIPPHAYCINVRINHAKRLLRTGVPIAEIAYDCGFVDQSHLTRWFKKIVGTTPGQYA